MQALLIAGFVTLAAAALPDKATLKSIFIDGQGTKAPGILTQAQIDSIDRELTIEYDLPAFTMGSAMPSPFNDTCGLTTISCPAHKFSLTPGMNVSTIGVRGFAMTSASDYLTRVSPTITFDMNAGKKVHLPHVRWLFWGGLLEFRNDGYGAAVDALLCFKHGSEQWPVG